MNTFRWIPMIPVTAVRSYLMAFVSVLMVVRVSPLRRFLSLKTAL